MNGKRGTHQGTEKPGSAVEHETGRENGGQQKKKTCKPCVFIDPELDCAAHQHYCGSYSVANQRGLWLFWKNRKEFLHRAPLIAFATLSVKKPRPFDRGFHIKDSYLVVFELRHG